jgi:ATP phosphoribosyltransferase regulatory subunit
MIYKKAALKPDEKVCLELRGLYEQFGYKKYKMSKFEEYSLYVENKDFLGTDKVITFTDLDGRLLALKPDVTLSIIKNTNATLQENEKLYYQENVYRENRESHTFTEINQMGLEYLGDIDNYAITEVITLAAESLKTISDNYILELAHMSFVVELLDSLQVSRSTQIDFLKQIRMKSADGIRLVAEKADLSTLQVESLCKLPTLYGDVMSTIEEAKKICLNGAMERALGEIAEIYQALEALGYADRIQLDLSIVNDIDYYNGIIFKGYVQELGKSVLAGGQYDQAMEYLGKKTSAIGFAVYLNEINRMMGSRKEYDVDAVIIYGENDAAADIAAAVKQLQAEEKTVRAEKNIPAGLKYKEAYTLVSGQLRKEGASC